MKQITLLTILLTSWIGLNAQPHDQGRGREKFEALQAAYITEKIDLSSKESQVFWPVFNERNEEVHDLRILFMEKVKKMKDA